MFNRILSKLGYRSQRWGDWDNLENDSQYPRYQAIASLIRLHCPSGVILDIGCGSGVMLPHLRGYKYVGVDRSREAIGLAKERVLNEDTESFLVGEADFIMGTQQKFNVVLFNEVVYYFDDPVAVVEEASQLLKAPGFVVVSVWHGDEHWHERDDDKHHGNTLAWRAVANHLGKWAESVCVKVGEGYSTIAIWKVL